MYCRDVMKSRVHHGRADESARDAAQSMRAHNVGFLPVCEDGGKVIGTLTDRDLAIRVLAQGRPPDTPVSVAMNRAVVSCSPDDDVRRAEQLMAHHRKSRVVCTDE